ncbi:MAG: hypothetical protein COA79_26085 [Planctomycetota bacterium]|nr:MAG: hypothetical protein COA79_26085 [Planctomycetota bacterium]
MNKDNISSLPNGIPFIVHIKNLTDEKLFNVKLINYDYKDQNKISYELGAGDVTYGEFLSLLSNRPETIMDTYIVAHCDYEKFQTRQLCSSFMIHERTSEGAETATPQTIVLDPFQVQTDRVLINKEYRLSTMDYIEFAYLMPETDIKLFLYPDPKSETTLEPVEIKPGSYGIEKTD